MGTFDSHVDTPDQIRVEGEQIVITFERTSASTGTLTWTIPPPAQGCTADTQAYKGIVIVGNTVANGVDNWPADGTVYIGDPTLDADLHAGSEIGGGLVVGAFYNDKTTTTLDVTGLQANTAYFFTGHAVDGVNRYHKQGVSTYALPELYTDAQPDRVAYQEVVFNEAVVDTDATGLDPTETYTIDLEVDGVDYTLRLRGSESLTYGELEAEINYQITLAEDPFEGANGPNAGAYWYDTSNEKLYQWDGSTLNEIPVIVDDTEPTGVVTGSFWLDTSDNTLYRWSGSAWVAQTVIESGFDPASPPDGSYWMQTSGLSPDTLTNAWQWEATVWCERPLFEQEKDPSCPPELTVGSYWYNTETSEIFVWDTELNKWVQTEGIAWDTDPRNPAIGTLWFNDTTNELFERTNATTWTQRTVLVSTTKPSPTAIAGTYWWDPTAQLLYTKVDTGSPLWIVTDAIVWGSDPTTPTSCDLWWDLSSSPTTLKVWDKVNNQWTQVEDFYTTATDPSQPQVLATGTVWAQTGGTSRVYWEWDGSQFVQISSTTIIEAADDPTDVAAGEFWLDTVNNVYYERVAGPTWSAIDPIESAQDPTMLSIGTFWFNTTTSTLNMWNGATWVNVMFSTTPPYPTSGTLWFNTSTNTLLEWDSNALVWVESTPIANATLNDTNGGASCEPNGNFVFKTAQAGSSGSILVGSVSTTSGSNFPTTSFVLTGSLWDALDLDAAPGAKPNVVGVDGLTGEQSYDRLGVGTDGSADERRALADRIRRRLGHPTVTVELTKEDLNIAIDKALEALRQKSTAGYRRVFFKIDAKEGVQNYLMTNERVGFHKIVTVMGCWRVTSAFQSTVYAAGVYGQTVLQHLYHMGTYDLISYHLISDYIEQLEQLFATRVTWTFDEGSRELTLFQRFTRDEQILLDTVIERTEQELMTNRYTKPWVERWAMAEAKMNLSQIRGKYASLPGAGGGVALNAGDLAASAQEDFALCMQDVDDFVVNDIENLGIGSELIIG